MKRLFHFLLTCRDGLLLLLGLLAINLGARAQAPAWQSAIPVGAAVNTVATNSSGDVIIAGSFNFTVSFGSTTLTSVGGPTRDVFVAKWHPADNSFVWAQRAGGTSDDGAVSLATSGNAIYVGGTYFSTASFGTASLANAGNEDVFLARLTDAGSSSSFVWAKSIGGSGTDLGGYVAANGTNVYVSGYFYSNALSIDGSDLTNTGSADGFAAKFTDAGSDAALAWKQQVSGPGDDIVFGLAVSGASVYVAGHFNDNATFGSTVLSSLGNYDVFVAKLADAGATGSFGWALRGGPAGEGSESEANALATNGSNVYLAGNFYGTDADFGGHVVTHTGNADVFVAKVTDAGNAGSFTWAQAAGGPDEDNATAVAVSGANVYVAGYFSTTATFGSTNLTSAGGTDIFTTRLTDAGSTGNFTGALRGGSTNDYERAFGVAAAGTAVYVGGYVQAPADFGSTTLTDSGTQGFLASINDTPLPTITSLNPTSGSVGTSVVITGTNFTGTTAVAFNSTDAPGFIVNSATQITVSVPSGATTGNVTVTTAGGTSNGVNFTTTALASYSFTGSPQTYTVPAGVTRLQVRAQGGGFSAGFRRGAVVTATIGVVPGEVLTIVAGGAGGPGQSAPPFAPGVGGYNGGGTGGGIEGGAGDGSFGTGSGGSGASDIRRIPGATATSPLAGGTLTSTSNNRLVIAGGAGGTDAGTGGTSSVDGGAGTASTGGAGGISDGATGFYNNGTDGSAGQGGNGGEGVGQAGPQNNSFGGSGGGGGYFGGGGGAGGGTVSNFGNSNYYATGIGGGGSSFVLPAALASGNTPAYTLAAARFDGSTDNGGLLLTPIFTTPTLTSINPTSGAVGSSVTLTGTNLTGATSVSFNGTTTSTFTSNNGTQLVLNVPSGATTGNVTVTTPAGTSNGVSFTVGLPDLVVSNPQSLPGGSYHNVTITSGGVLSLSGTLTVTGTLTVQDLGTLRPDCQLITGPGSFVLAAGGTLNICSAAGISTSGATGEIQVSGTRTYSSDAVYGFVGDGVQQTGSGFPDQVRELSVFIPGSSLTVQLSRPLRIARLLVLYGNLNTMGQSLTLLSNAQGNADVTDAGGVVTGLVTVQRYIDPSLNPGFGYRQYSAPVSGSTVDDLRTTNAGGSFVPVVNSAYNGLTPNDANPFPNVFDYNQARLADAALSALPLSFGKGWESPASLNAPLTVGRGYTVQIAATEKVDFTGTLNTGTIPLTLARNTSGTAAENAASGLHLIGNPYPSPLDWSSVTRDGVDAALFVFESTDAYKGAYRSFVNGIPSSAFVATGQGFFVRVNSARSSGTVTFTNASRLNGDVAFHRGGASDQRPQLHLSLGAAGAPLGARDLTYVYEQAGATAGLDGEFDAVKLPNPSGLGLSSRAATQELAISGLPVLTQATIVPLTVRVPAAGTYTLRAEQVLNLPAGAHLYLVDSQTGQQVELTASPATTLTVTATNAGAWASRFYINWVPAANALATTSALRAESVQLYPNPVARAASFTVLMPAVAGARQVQGTLLNSLGQVVRQLPATALPASGARLLVPTENLPGGVYTLSLTAGASIVAKRLIVE